MTSLFVDTGECRGKVSKLDLPFEMESAAIFTIYRFDTFVYVAGLPAMILELASCVIKAGLGLLALLSFVGLLVGCPLHDAMTKRCSWVFLLRFE